VEKLDLIKNDKKKSMEKIEYIVSAHACAGVRA
jgi:hypothetical protein